MDISFDSCLKDGKILADFEVEFLCRFLLVKRISLFNQVPSVICILR